MAYDPELAKSLLAKSGYSPEKPVKFTIQTTRGFKPKDYEMIQAIVGMWRKVGIDANIEIYEIAQHFELRARHALAPAAFYNWGNAIGDPTTSTGFAMFGPSPHCAWKGKDLVERIGPLWGEKDEAKRIAGWKAVDKYIAEEGEVIPLFQYVQPIIHKKGLKVVAQANGMILPQLITSGLGSGQGETIMRWGEMVRQLVLIPPTLVGVAAIVFVLLRIVPGDPIAMMIPPGASPADIERLRAFYGLDRSIPEQFISWFGQVFSGDFGRSISLHQNVFELVLARLPATLELALVATLIAIVLGLLVALTGVYFRGRRAEWVIDGGVGVFLAIPDFLWALILLLLFGVLIPLLPISGRIDPQLDFSFRSNFYLH